MSACKALRIRLKSLQGKESWKAERFRSSNIRKLGPLEQSRVRKFRKLNPGTSADEKSERESLVHSCIASKCSDSDMSVSNASSSDDESDCDMQSAKAFVDETIECGILRPEICYTSLQTFEDYIGSGGVFNSGSGANHASRTRQQYRGYIQQAMELVREDLTQEKLGKEKLTVYDFCDAEILGLLLPNKCGFFVGHGSKFQSANKNKFFSLKKLLEFCAISKDAGYTRALSAQTQAVLQLLRNISVGTNRNVQTVSRIRKGMDSTLFSFVDLVPKVMSACASRLLKLSSKRNHNNDTVDLTADEFYIIEGCVALLLFCLLGPHRVQIFTWISFMLKPIEDKASLIEDHFRKRMGALSQNDDCIVWLEFGHDGNPERLTIVFDKVGSTFQPTVYRLPYACKEVIKCFLSSIRPLVCAERKHGAYLFLNYKGNGVYRKLSEKMNLILKDVHDSLSLGSLRSSLETQMKYEERAVDVNKDVQAQALSNLIRHSSQTGDKYYIQPTKTQHQTKVHYGQLVRLNWL